MEAQWILKLVLFGLTHWVLVGLVLPDIAGRKRVMGGKKWPWVVGVIFFTCFGSLAYLAFHPQVIVSGFSEKGAQRGEEEDYYCR